MKLFTRVSGLAPPPLRRMLEAHERVIAVADTADSAVLASQLGLWLPTSDSSWRRVGWHDVVRAAWTDSGLELVEGVCDEDGVVSDLPPVQLTLSQARDLPVVVRQRVEASIARWEQIRVPGGAARLVARRVPGVDGLLWTARFDTGTPDTPSARELAVTRLRQARFEAERAATM